jgi:sugar O-acyltransferase (sialic acid O-acetyltransferase NeuD family)
MNDRPSVAIIGAGGHAHVMLDVLRCQGASNVIGFLDDADDLQGTRTRGGIEVIGRTDPETIRNCGADAFVVAIGSNQIRQMLFERCIDAGLTPWTAVHPSATVAASATIGDGAHVVAGVCVCTHARVGADVILNTACSVDHDNLIGDHAFIAPGAHLGGDVEIGSRAFVGIGASVLPGLTVGARATVGGGAVVIEDVPPDSVVVGVPARIIRRGEAE